MFFLIIVINLFQLFVNHALRLVEFAEINFKCAWVIHFVMIFDDQVKLRATNAAVGAFESNLVAVLKRNHIEGKVIVQFFIEKTGKVGEVKVARGVDKELDAEAVRVCKLLPKFSPGRNADGEPIKIWYTLPITFKIQESAPEVTE